MKDLKYGRVLLDNKDTPGDEPCFVLRGQDVHASATVRYYALLCSNAGAPVDHVKAIARAAAELDAWPVKKTPD